MTIYEPNTNFIFLRFDRDPRWSETGDRYIIKLFRDHVFHSVDESGNPVVNLSHVLTNLNKVRSALLATVVLDIDWIECLAGCWH